MNLRQKVKQAKRELQTFDEKYYGSSSWEIYQKFKDKMKLQETINHKRKISRYYHWNEEQEIDWNKLTYISLHADFVELATLKTANGRVLKKEVVVEFLNGICMEKLIDYARKVQKEEVDIISSGLRKHVDYLLVVSNDSTKAKKWDMEKVYYQFEGDDKLYPYKGDK